MSEQFHRLCGVLASDPHQRHVDAVGGGPAHHSGHDHDFPCHAYGNVRGAILARLVFGVGALTIASRRTCSPNSHSFRESFSTVAAEAGAFVCAEIFADFFLNASTRRDRLLNAPRELRIALRRRYQFFVSLRNVILAMADQAQISAGANEFNRGHPDRRRRQDCRPSPDRPTRSDCGSRYVCAGCP